MSKLTSALGFHFFKKRTTSGGDHLVNEIWKSKNYPCTCIIAQNVNNRLPAPEYIAKAFHLQRLSIHYQILFDNFGMQLGRFYCFEQNPSTVGRAGILNSLLLIHITKYTFDGAVWSQVLQWLRFLTFPPKFSTMPDILLKTEWCQYWQMSIVKNAKFQREIQNVLKHEK